MLQSSWLCWQGHENSLLASATDGSMLKWDDIVASLPKTYQGNAQRPDAQWTFISSVEHPHLNTPWFMLHPCQTAELMQLMLAADASSSQCPPGNAQTASSCDGGRYMKAWLSLIAPVVRLQQFNL